MCVQRRFAFPVPHACRNLRLNTHKAHSHCVCVCVGISPNPSGGAAAGCTREGKGTMNDIDRQRAAERLPVPETLSRSLTADVCLIAEGLGALDTSLSPLSLPARKLSPLQSPRSLLLIRGLIFVNHCALRSPLRPAAWITRETRPARMERWSREI